MVSELVALKWTMSLEVPRDKLARWMIEIQNYNFDTEHRNGLEVVVPYTLSRDAVPNPV